MNLLLDTHAVIWSMTEPEKLPSRTREEIEDINNTSYVSIVSFWEMGIKHSLGKLELNNDLPTIFDLIDESGLNILAITPSHILTNSTLHFYHQDPFDRLIIAQAQSESFTIVSKDGMFKNYNVDLLWHK